MGAHIFKVDEIERFPVLRLQLCERVIELMASLIFKKRRLSERVVGEFKRKVIKVDPGDASPPQVAQGQIPADFVKIGAKAAFFPDRAWAGKQPCK